MKTWLLNGENDKSHSFLEDVSSPKWIIFLNSRLVSHVDDPCLSEEDSCRVFYLALCPVGDFSHQVEEYWSACQQGELGWNTAHELPPCIMLLSDFKVGGAVIVFFL